MECRPFTRTSSISSATVCPPSPARRSAHVRTTHEDFQDTLWGLTDTVAAVVERYFYTDPYGKSETKNGAGTNIGAFATNVFHRKRLHGGFVEAVSELYDFRNRWYLLGSAQFSSPDPMGFVDGFNRYQFAYHSPLYWSDPWGLDTITNDTGKPLSWGASGKPPKLGTIDNNKSTALPGQDVDMIMACCAGCSLFKCPGKSTTKSIRCYCVRGEVKCDSGCYVVRDCNKEPELMDHGWNPKMICAMCRQQQSADPYSAPSFICWKCCDVTHVCAGCMMLGDMYIVGFPKGDAAAAAYLEF